jgi:pimeloyl-ACP methyl ester carboxylesterase
MTLTVGGIELETVRRGAGRTLLFLHGMQTVDPSARWLELLAPHVEIIAPSSPGFGGSSRPAEFDTVYDLVQLYRELIEALPAPVILVGHSFGGWLAAELAASCAHRLDRLVLVDAFGLKLSDRETADILDVFNSPPAAVRRAAWHDPDRWAPNFEALSDDAISCHARSWEALCRYGWKPYMYNPQLKHWLRRIALPTLVLWGEQDGIVTPSYGRAYSALIPGARFETIARAGHAPHLEQADEFADRLIGFLER